LSKPGTIIGFFVLFVALTAQGVLGQQKRSTGKTRHSSKAKRRLSPAAPKDPAAGFTTKTGLSIFITKHGSGVLAKAGDTVSVQYTGTLTNGVKFDSSHDRGEPFSFKLGTGSVIKGWDEGIALMHIGDQAILVIPPQIAYGSKGAGNGVIAPDATLIFVVELVDAK
jgi:peptidylprolyl isomerase